MSRLLSAAILLAAGLCVLVAAAGPVRGHMSIRIPTSSNPNAIGLAVRWDLANNSSLPNVANRRILYEIADAGCADAPLFTGPVNEFEAIQNSFSKWREIRESDLDFQFNGATTNAVTDANDSRNIVRWVNSGISTGVFAVTITTFDTLTAEIVDADLELNDRDFTWDTLGPTGTQGVIGRAMIESVVTHEIGHMVGLDHAANAGGAMFFASSPGMIDQTVLEADDRALIRADYAHPSLSDASLGSVAGTVDDGFSGAFGVEVLLIDMSTGENVIGHVTESDQGIFTEGEYLIEGVPPGNYMALALPVDPGNLGSFYATAYTSFYPIVAGVPEDTIGAPTVISVAPGQAVTGVNLSLPSASQDPYEPDGSSALSNLIDSGEVAVSSIWPASEEDWYEFTTTTANQVVTIRVISDMVGWTLNPTLTLYDTDGSTLLVSPDFGNPFYMPSANDVDDTAFDLNGVNFDATIVRTMASAGTYYFAVASRVGATAGEYVVTLEISGENTTADANAGTISSSAPGIAAGGVGTFSVTVTPRNLHGRDLNTTTFTVELIDRTGGGSTLLQTVTSTTPFVFTVSALATSQVVTYGATIDTLDIAAIVDVSHYSTLSTANSRMIVQATSLTANGYDRSPVVIELRDGSGNPFTDASTNVTVSTSLGSLDNGSVTGSSNVAAVYDAATGKWFIDLVAGTATGTATLTAFANSTQIDSKTVPFLTRATGTGGGGGGVDPGDDDDDGGGGCAAAETSGIALILLVAAGLATRRRRRRS